MRRFRPQIRARTGLSRAAFARQVGVKKAVLLNWEPGRRKPDGAGTAGAGAGEPGIVRRVLGGGDERISNQTETSS